MREHFFFFSKLFEFAFFQHLRRKTPPLQGGYVWASALNRRKRKGETPAPRLTATKSTMSKKARRWVTKTAVRPLRLCQERRRRHPRRRVVRVLGARASFGGVSFGSHLVYALKHPALRRDVQPRSRFVEKQTKRRRRRRRLLCVTNSTKFCVGPFLCLHTGQRASDAQTLSLPSCRNTQTNNPTRSAALRERRRKREEEGPVGGMLHRRECRGRPRTKSRGEMRVLRFELRRWRPQTSDAPLPPRLQQPTKTRHLSRVFRLPIKYFAQTQRRVERPLTAKSQQRFLRLLSEENVPAQRRLKERRVLSDN